MHTPTEDWTDGDIEALSASAITRAGCTAHVICALTVARFLGHCLEQCKDQRDPAAVPGSDDPLPAEAAIENRLAALFSW
jgi:hypothetical protein